MNDETRFLPTDPEQPEEPEQQPTDQAEQPEQTEQAGQAGQATFLDQQLTEPEPAAIPYPPVPERRSTGSHPVNVGQLAMGLVFLAAVGVWALIQSDTVTGDDIRWLLPLPWVIGGGIGLVAAAVSSVRRHGVGR